MELKGLRISWLTRESRSLLADLVGEPGGDAPELREALGGAGAGRGLREGSARRPEPLRQVARQQRHHRDAQGVDEERVDHVPRREGVERGVLVRGRTDEVRGEGEAQRAVRAQAGDGCDDGAPGAHDHGAKESGEPVERRGPAGGPPRDVHDPRPRDLVEGELREGNDLETAPGPEQRREDAGDGEGPREHEERDAQARGARGEIAANVEEGRRCEEQQEEDEAKARHPQEAAREAAPCVADPEAHHGLRP